MSDFENTGGNELLVCSERMALPVPILRGPDPVYEELNRLAELMPQRYAEVFRLRWGLDTEAYFPYLMSQVARRLEIPQGTVEEMLDRCLWNVARFAHTYELPAIHRLLGEVPAKWASRAWVHAEQRWGNEESNCSEVALLLAAAGLDVPEARRCAANHKRGLRVGRGERCGGPMTAARQTKAARVALDRILGQVIWPAKTAQLPNLNEFTTQRPLPAWAPAKSGVFRSGTSDRLVQFDSELELLMLKQFDADERIVEYREQPLTIPYSVEGYTHEYTPDVIVRLGDGRAFVVEMKPSDLLGDFTNWMKWASLANWCEHRGVGFWIGSPQNSLGEHVRIEPDAEKRDFVLDELKAGPITGEDYLALSRLVGREQLGLIASTESLDWRGGWRHLQRPTEADHDAAEQLKLTLLRVGMAR